MFPEKGLNSANDLSLNSKVHLKYVKNMHEKYLNISLNILIFIKDL